MQDDSPYAEPERHEIQTLTRTTRGDTLADVLERVLDKGIVVAGDVVINLLNIELLSIKLRLLIASVDKAREIGIDWWETDPALSRNARAVQEQRELSGRVARLEEILAGMALPEGNGPQERTRSSDDANAAGPFDAPTEHVSPADGGGER